MAERMNLTEGRLSTLRTAISMMHYCRQRIEIMADEVEGNTRNAEAFFPDTIQTAMLSEMEQQLGNIQWDFKALEDDIAGLIVHMKDFLDMKRGLPSIAPAMMAGYTGQTVNRSLPDPPFQKDIEVVA